MEYINHSYLPKGLGGGGILSMYKKNRIVNNNSGNIKGIEYEEVRVKF